MWYAVYKHKNYCYLTTCCTTQQLKSTIKNNLDIYHKIEPQLFYSKICYEKDNLSEKICIADLIFTLNIRMLICNGYTLLRCTIFLLGYYNNFSKVLVQQKLALNHNQSQQQSYEYTFTFSSTCYLLFNFFGEKSKYCNNIIMVQIFNHLNTHYFNRKSYLSLQFINKLFLKNFIYQTLYQNIFNSCCLYSITTWYQIRHKQSCFNTFNLQQTLEAYKRNRHMLRMLLFTYVYKQDRLQVHDHQHLFVYQHSLPENVP
eukprot:TRINITY_DN1464_c0_g1_i4.p1 TRINITY_DN1464_c0_g1~~TRINITY_DN1464_c0_g1_i4.p1  ORF type:complete len:258 (+),score=-24.65 TRINITY_DN1464_c0_g1_i4:390-1163(+)